ncbi:glycosyltransferase family 4 protein [Neisseria sp.]|uniref:glycosyltransferase family 4 protein n=1 Tax=Neisseria sp. TaxID=192066 RepID=UPI0035A065B7
MNADTVLIDITRLIFRLLKGKKATGVDKVGLAYIRHFSAAYGQRARAVLSWRGRVCVQDAQTSALLFGRLLQDNEAETVDVWFWRRQLLRLAAAFGIDKSYAGAVLLNTGHKGVESVHYIDALRRMGVKPVYFVHDLIPLTHPEYCREGEEAKHRLRMRHMLQSAAALIANSDDTKRELLDFAQRHGLPCPPVQTAWLASGVSRPLAETAAVPSEISDGLPYFIVVGTVEARKNHLLLLQIWREMAESGSNVPRLVIVGQRGWECEQTVDLLERCAKIRPFVVELNRASDAQLAALLKNARALLFPSFAEGFGMPLVEALEAGVPVIAADIPVFREIGQGIPDFASPLDGRRWLELIKNYADSDGLLRTQQLQRLLKYRAWTWDDHFAAVDGFLSEHGLAQAGISDESAV